MTQFLGTCVSFEAEDIHDYDDKEKEITYRTFARHLGREMMREVNGWFGVPLSRDWCVSFGKGTFKGKPVVVLHHSRIHHFFEIH
jgi:hypothetical protein